MRTEREIKAKLRYAFHGDPSVKDKYLARVAAHCAADQLIQGVGWENGKGCAIGCTLEAYDHARYETELGIPQMLARLEDAIFEGLANGESQKWPERFLSAIRPGADLSLVGWKFLLWLFEDTQSRYGTDDVRKACEPVGEVLKAKAKGKSVSASAASRAARAARSAARSAAAASAARSSARSAAWSAESAAWSAASRAESAARSAAASAAARAESAAWSAAWSAARAARSAAWSAAWSAARSAAWLRMADKLVELLEAA